MIPFHIITVVSRPQNLKLLADSIAAALVPDVKAIWWIVYDAPVIPTEDFPRPVETRSFAEPSLIDGKRISEQGFHQANFALGKIEDGWVFFLDDDTTMHPRLIRAVAPILAAVPGCNVVLSQSWKDGSRRLHVGSDHVISCHIDGGMVVLAKSTIGDHRFATTMYGADGPFLEAIFKCHPDSFIFLNEVLCVFNALR